MTSRQQEYSPARDGHQWMQAALDSAADQTGTPRREDGRAADPARPLVLRMTSKRVENSDQKGAETGFSSKRALPGMFKGL